MIDIEGEWVVSAALIVLFQQIDGLFYRYPWMTEIILRYNTWPCLPYLLAMKCFYVNETFRDSFKVV